MKLEKHIILTKDPNHAKMVIVVDCLWH